jgi:mono/diheme cytochrome c family protein
MRKLAATLVLVAPGIIACGDQQETVSSEVEQPMAEPRMTELPETSDDMGPLAQPPVAIDLVMPEANARRGRILFIADGCVICHQVNGVGGTAAPALDIMRDDHRVDPLAFAARMWDGAEAMTALQMMQRGYVITLDGQDIADLAAFAASPEERALLTDASVTDEMRSWFLSEPYWTQGEWTDFLETADPYPFDTDLPESERPD